MPDFPDAPDSRFFAEHPEVLRGAVAPVQLDGVLPLDWVDDITPDSARADVMADNATLLRALLMLDDSAATAAAPADPARADALQNLERRLDLLMLMASTALRGLQPLPPDRPCVLSSRKLRFGAEHPLQAGRRLWARLYLRHRVALPLILPGTVVEIEHTPRMIWHTLQLDPLDAALQNDLDRLIFRHHRREVARQRRQNA